MKHPTLTAVTLMVLLCVLAFTAYTLLPKPIVVWQFIAVMVAVVIVWVVMVQVVMRQPYR